jgi:acetyltransferase
MRQFFHPKSVAVIGVSPRESNLARQIVKNLHEFSFDGIIHLVGPKGGICFGRRIYRSVADIPDYVDLAVILTPAHTVPDIMEQLGEKGIHRAVIETAGFREYGEEGRRIEERIVEIAQKHNIRFIGPNCIGVMNRHNGLSVPFASLKNVYPEGDVTIITQSGGVGISYLNALASENIGLNCFASIGNKLNVDENDLLEHFLEDPATSIICMYLESVSDGKRLMELGRKANKPILVHKSNTGRLSRSIAASHTASISGDDDVIHAALKQCGIARFYEPEQLINYLKALPMPRIKGNRLAILSRSGGHAVIAADECEQQGFGLAEFPKPFIEEVEKHFRANVIKLSNPLDLGDLFDIDVYRRIIERTLTLPEVDGVVFLHTYVSQTEGEASRALIDSVMEYAEVVGKPLAICVETDNIESAALKHDLAHPVFTDVEDAIRSLAMARDYGKGSIREPNPPELDVDKSAVQRILDQCTRLERDPSLSEALAIAGAYGLPCVSARVAVNEDEAVLAANQFGYPVVLKVIAPEVSHKTDLGGVQLNLKTENSVRNAFGEITKSIQSACPNARIEGVLVQGMARSGPEILIGGKQDPNFGPAVMVGIGGIFVEVFKEVAIRIAPFGVEEARAMIHELTISPILDGVRGQDPYDSEALVDILVRVSRLMTDHPAIKELDFNPVRIYHNDGGCKVLDARIILES